MDEYLRHNFMSSHQSIDNMVGLVLCYFVCSFYVSHNVSSCLIRHICMGGGVVYVCLFSSLYVWWLLRSICKVRDIQLNVGWLLISITSNPKCVRLMGKHLVFILEGILFGRAGRYWPRYMSVKYWASVFGTIVRHTL